MKLSVWYWLLPVREDASKSSELLAESLSHSEAVTLRLSWCRVLEMGLPLLRAASCHPCHEAGTFTEVNNVDFLKIISATLIKARKNNPFLLKSSLLLSQKNSQ